jgi:hypothetical protein
MALSQFKEGTVIENGVSWLWDKLLVLYSNQCLFMVYKLKQRWPNFFEIREK